MFIFRPTYVFENVAGITPAFLKRMHIKGIILDVDNTMTTHNDPTPTDYSLKWLESVKKAGIKLIIVSNNKPQRVEPFAEILGLEELDIVDGDKRKDPDKEEIPVSGVVFVQVFRE